MVRPILHWSILLLMGTVLLTSPATAAPGSDFKRAVEVRDLLRTPFRYTGIAADPKTTLAEALEELANHHGITFEANEATFRAEGIGDVLNTPVAEVPIPASNDLSLDRVLRRILARVPGATFVNRGDVIEITTVQAVVGEFYPGQGSGPLPPLMISSYEKLPLRAAFENLAELSGVTIILDGRLEKKGETAVTARLFNVPLDTAVALLADSAGLKVVQRDNVFYVTDPENARKLEQEQKPRARKKPGATPLPGSTPAIK